MDEICGSDSDSYHSYPSEDEIPCSSYAVEDMISDSDEGEPVTISLEVKEAGALYERHDDLSHFVDSIITTSEDSCMLYPQAMLSSTEHINLTHKVKKFTDKGFVYLSRSLVVTLDAENNRIKVPKDLICDALIFTRIRPVMLLSFVPGKAKTDKLQLYNSLLAKCVTEILRKDLRYNIAVVSGVVEEESDLCKQVQEIHQNACYFTIPESLMMNKMKFIDSLRAFFAAVAKCEAHPAEQCHRKLDKNELDLLTQIIEGPGVETPKVDTSLALEIGRRLSRSGKTKLHLKADVKKAEINHLREHYPKLDVCTTPEETSDNGQYKYIITGDDASDVNHAHGEAIGLHVESTSKKSKRSHRKKMKDMVVGTLNTFRNSFRSDKQKDSVKTTKSPCSSPEIRSQEDALSLLEVTAEKEKHKVSRKLTKSKEVQTQKLQANNEDTSSDYGSLSGSAPSEAFLNVLTSPDESREQFV